MVKVLLFPNKNVVKALLFPNKNVINLVILLRMCNFVVDYGYGDYLRNKYSIKYHHPGHD